VIVFNTEDNKYKIILDNKFSSSIYHSIQICSISFLDPILNNTIFQFNISNISINNFIDNILSFIELEEDILYSFNDLDQLNNFNNIFIGLSIEDNKQFFTIYKFFNNEYNKLIKFEITNSLELFVDNLMNEFLDIYID
jgi:hypothetical protein